MSYSKGYLIIANSEQEIKAATACAYSILSHNKDALITLVNKDAGNRHGTKNAVFDNVVSIPFGQEADHRRLYDWQLYWATSYTYNIVVDCYSLIKEDLSSTWDYLLDHYELCFPTKVLNFKNETLFEQRYESLEKRDLHTVYSDLFFFKKDSDIALNYFKLLDPYSKEWKIICDKFFERHEIPLSYDPNLIHSLCVGHLDIFKECTPLHDNILSYIDMALAKQHIFDKDIDNYTNYMNVWPSTNGKIKIQNFALSRSISYTLPEFLTEEIFNGQREYYKLTSR